MTNNEVLRLGRAKNAVLTFLEKSLYVPKIYLNAQWDSQQLDVLAIDRDGVGDVHAVLLFPSECPKDPDGLVHTLNYRIQPLIERFQQIPAQFKYIGAVDVSPYGGVAMPGVPPAMLEESYAPDGLGRISFLSIDFPTNGEPIVKSLFKPERFRARIAKLADEYVQQHSADWEIRP